MSSSRHVLNDLISSEYRYVNTLALLTNEYVVKIERKVNPRHLNELNPFFALIKSLHSLHLAFQSDLNRRIDIGPLFLRTIPSLRLYLQYADVYSRAIANIHIAYKQSRKFKSCIDRPLARATAGAILGVSVTGTQLQGSALVSSANDIFALLDHVLHRIPQYCLYVNDLKSQHDVDDSERQSLTAAMAQLEEIDGAMKSRLSATNTNSNTPVQPFRAHPSASLSHSQSGRRSIEQQLLVVEPHTPVSANNDRSGVILSTPMQNRSLGPTSPAPMSNHAAVTPPPIPLAAAMAARGDDLTKRRQSLPTTFSNGSVAPSLVTSIAQSPVTHTSQHDPDIAPLMLTHTSSDATNVPFASPLSPSEIPINNSVAIFRYVPRVVLQRFIACDAQIRAPPSHARNRAITVSSYLPSSQSPEVHHYPSATILVADVSGFTKLNETFSVMEKGAGAEQVTTHLNRYFSSLLNIIERHGGDCVKFAGDALIVLFLPAKQWLTDSGKQYVDDSIASQSSAKNSQTSHDSDTDASNDRSRFPLPLLDKGNRAREEQSETCLRAVQCALQLQNDVGVYHGSLVDREADTVSDNHSRSHNQPHHRRERSEARVSSVELALHIAIGCGAVYGFHVGGHSDEFEFVLTGQAFGQLKEGLDLSKRGEVVVSKNVWDLISHRCSGQQCTTKANKLCRTGEVRVVSVESPIKLSSMPKLDFLSLASHSFIPLALRAYVPRSVLDMLDAHSDNGGSSSWLSEIRTTTVIFVNLSGLTLNKNDSSDATQTHKVCIEMQKIIARNQGYRRQFLVDDKGTTLIVVFGVPPFSHEDDAYRGVKCALEMREALLALNVAHGMGITTGVVYSGSVGSKHRQEHAVVGDIVNTAARIANKAENTAGSNGYILLDQSTHDATVHAFQMRVEGEITVKGKNRTIKIYTPIKADRLAVMNATSAKSHTETINRGNEQAQFMQALVELQSDGTSAALFIEGESGVGKTHLIRQFYRIVQSHAATVHSMYAKGDATASSSVLSIWTPIIEELIGLSAPNKSSSTAQKRTKQLMKFFKLVQPNSPLDPRLPFINLVLSEPVNVADNDLSKAIKNQPKQILKQAEGIVHFMIANALKQKKMQGKHSVLFFEDLQSFDASSLEVLKRVAQTVKPLLLVCTARPPAHRSPTLALSPTHPVQSQSSDGFPGNLSRATSMRWSERFSRRGSEGGMSVENSVVSHSHSNSVANDWHGEEKEDDDDSGGSKGDDGSEEKEIPVPPPLIHAPTMPPPAISRTTSVTTTGTSQSSGSQSQQSRSDPWSDAYESWLKLPNLIHIRLEGLGENTCTRLVCQRLHAMSLDPSLAQLIMKRSRGNPLYACELAQNMMEKGYLVLRHDGHCLVNPNATDASGKKVTVDEASLDLPTSLKGLVTKRLDNLPVIDLLVCKLASAFGYEEFDRNSLIQLCADENVSDAQTLASIQSLQQANIIGQREIKDFNGAVVTVMLYFLHELVQSACYDLLVMSQKLRLHFRLASMELKRQQQRAAASANAGVSAGDTPLVSAQTPPHSAVRAVDDSSANVDTGGGGFRSRLAATLRRKKPSIDDSAINPSRADESEEAEAVTEPSTSAGALTSPTDAATSSSLKRRASVLTYHYTMALQSYKGSGDQSDEIKQFIRQAKDYLNQRLSVLGQDTNTVESNVAQEAAQALELHNTGLHSPPAIAWGESGGSAGKPPPAPNRRSWSANLATTPPARPQVTPTTTRITGAKPPPLPLSTQSATGSPASSITRLSCPPAVDSPVVAPNASHPLTATPPPLPASHSTTHSMDITHLHVTVAQLYASLNQAHLPQDAKEKIVAALIAASKNNITGTRSPLPPPLPHIQHASSAPALDYTTGAVMLEPPLPRTLSDSPVHGAHDLIESESSTSQSRATEDFSPSLPLTPLSATTKLTVSQRPPSPSSAASTSMSSMAQDSPRSTLSASNSFTLVTMRSLERPSSMGSPSPIGSPLSTATAHSGVNLAIDALVKMSREDLMQLRNLAKQTRPPSAATRKALECMALLVNGLSSGAKKGTTASKTAKPAAGGVGKDSWREIVSSSLFINQLTKVSPISERRGSNSAAAPASAAAAAIPVPMIESLQAYLSDPALNAPVHQRSMMPSVKVIWQWVQAVAAHYGIGSQSAPTSQMSELESKDTTTFTRTRTRSRSRSVELAAPVSPVDASPPESPAPEREDDSSCPVQAPGKRGSVKGRGSLGVKKPSVTRTPSLPSPRSAVDSRLSTATKARSQATASSSSTNVHLSVNAALKMRRKSSSGNLAVHQPANLH